MLVLEKDNPCGYGVQNKKERPTIKSVYVTSFNGDFSRYNRMYLVSYDGENFIEPFTKIIFKHVQSQVGENVTDYVYIDLEDSSRIEFKGHIDYLDSQIPIGVNKTITLGLLLQEYLSQNEYYMKDRVNQEIREKQRIYNIQKDKIERNKPVRTMSENELDEITKRLSYLIRK